MQKWMSLALLGLTAYLCYVLFLPLSKGQSPLNFGLDLAGGVVVSYRPDFSTRPEGYQSRTNKELLDMCKETLTNRLSRKLKTIPEIYIRGDDRLIVSIPSVENYQQVLELVGKTYRLNMRLVLEESTKPIEGPNVYRYRSLYLRLDKPAFSGDMLDERRIKVLGGNPSATDPDERAPSVAFGFRRPYDVQFRNFTRENIHKRLAILLDESVEVAGIIQSEIENTGVLTGSDSLERAQDEAIVLRSGTLPISLEMVGLSGVGPSLGQEVKSKGLTTLLLSLLLLFLLMFIVYVHRIWFLLAGAISLLTLLFFLVGLASVFRFTLDTAAIAGIILSLAMGVDAFIIIFESLEPKMKHFASAELSRFGSIIVEEIYSFRNQGLVLLHPNATILMVVLLLLQSDRLRSFAQFMCLGIGASILTILVTRRVLLHTSSMASHEGPDLIRWVRQSKPGIFRFRKQYLSAFALLVAAYLFVCFRQPGTLGMALGADFTPGAQMLCESSDERTLQAAISAVQTAHPQFSARYQKLNPGENSNRYLVTVSTPSASPANYVANTGGSATSASRKALPSFGDEPAGTPEKIAPLAVPPSAPGLGRDTAVAPANLVKILGDGHVRVLSFDSIDSKVSASRLFSSLTLLPLSCGLLLFYFIALEPRISGLLSKNHSSLTLNQMGRTLVAVGIVLSAVHDIIVMLFVCAVFHIEFSLSVIAAVLTIVGYSVMDSVVIWNYVRSRAERCVAKHETFDPVSLVSDGIDATFSRVVLTGISTLIPVFAILLVNVSPLRDFAVLIAVGTLSGTLSSVFVVGPFAVRALSYSRRPSAPQGAESLPLPLGHGTVRDAIDQRLAALD